MSRVLYTDASGNAQAKVVSTEKIEAAHSIPDGDIEGFDAIPSILKSPKASDTDGGYLRKVAQYAASGDVQNITPDMQNRRHRILGEMKISDSNSEYIGKILDRSVNYTDIDCSDTPEIVPFLLRQSILLKDVLCLELRCYLRNISAKRAVVAR